MGDGFRRPAGCAANHRKSGRGNHVFFDGHVETLTPAEILDKTTTPNYYHSGNQTWPLF